MNLRVICLQDCGDEARWFGASDLVEALLDACCSRVNVWSRNPEEGGLLEYKYDLEGPFVGSAQKLTIHKLLALSPPSCPLLPLQFLFQVS
jgi:hypothetical protein